MCLIFPLDLNALDLLVSSGSSYLLIFTAEMGDKSQLVCMALAARYRARPVILGAVLAFILLNTIAVVFGVAIASWIPEVWISAIVALLFAVFGIQALRLQGEHEEESASTSGKNVLLATFILISIAEFGDKTQLAVVALSSSSIPLAVWLGSTLALITTSVLGIWAGRTLLQRLNMRHLQRISGVFFILLAVFATYKSFTLWSAT